MDAGEVLDQVAAGAAPLPVLAWIPLMKRGDDPGIIQRWKELADKHAERRRRSGLASVGAFADLAGRGALWEQVLMDYPMTESPWINEVLRKAIKEGVEKGIEERLEKAVEERLEKAIEERMKEPNKQLEALNKQLEEGRSRQEEAVREARKETQMEVKRNAVVAFLEARFGPSSLPPDLTSAIREVRELARLDAILTQAAKAASLADFRRDAGL
jgi:hypothetical protein